MILKSRDTAPKALAFRSKNWLQSLSNIKYNCINVKKMIFLVNGHIYAKMCTVCTVRVYIIIT